MSFVTQTYGYLERPYLNDPYMTGYAEANGGLQVQFIIQDDKAVGVQVAAQILDFLDANGIQSMFVIQALKNLGIQTQFTILDDKSVGMQFESIPGIQDARGVQTSFVIADIETLGLQSTFTILDDKPIGIQVLANIQDYLRPIGMQVLAQILDYRSNKGMEARFDKSIAHTTCGYLEAPYLSDAYLAECFKGTLGVQSQFVISDTKDVAMQVQAIITDARKNMGVQTLARIEDYRKNMGVQADFVKITSLGLQTLVTLYNTTNLRILCHFPSRGSSIISGTNAWGQSIGYGRNWVSSSTQAGDFSVYNLNTDIIEQYWRSASGVVTGINLDCDTEINQGVFLDTLAILGHNMTKSANVSLIGSNVSNFAVVGTTIPLQQGENNSYWIAPILPNAGYRYWRLQIDDSTNPDGFIKIGTVIFGAARIFQGECFVDELEYTLKDFADTVRTEGFTNVANSRAQKSLLRLEFRFLDLEKGNYKILRDMFTDERTVLKCLYIPTPDENNDQDIMSRFAVFGKLTSIPTERHANRGKGADYVSFGIEVDESM
jgi:hypothetical protein